MSTSTGMDFNNIIEKIVRKEIEKLKKLIAVLEERIEKLETL